jgi:hypothetical protein
MTQQEFADMYLIEQNGGPPIACIEAITWLRDTCTVDNICDLRLAWAKCHRIDWLLWAYCRTTETDFEKIAEFSSWCASLANRAPWAAPIGWSVISPRTHANAANHWNEELANATVQLAMHSVIRAVWVANDAYEGHERHENRNLVRVLVTEKFKEIIECPW